ncbi:hypothetical protein GCM10025857_63490 [Alicyclobacillus contaminans]|nr:hypothetical protein GCM10025857_63490 [Alicyclobacillus contaminans]
MSVELGENQQLNATLYSESSMGQSTELTLQQILSSIQTNLRAEELGLSSNKVQSLNQAAAFNQQRVSFNDADEMELGRTRKDLTLRLVLQRRSFYLFLLSLTQESFHKKSLRKKGHGLWK